MPLPAALAAKLAKRGILQQSDTNTASKAKSAEGKESKQTLVCRQVQDDY